MTFQSVWFPWFRLGWFTKSTTILLLYFLLYLFIYFVPKHLQNEVKKELDRLLQSSSEPHSPKLAEDEVTAVKRNLQTNNIEATPAEVCALYNL